MITILVIIIVGQLLLNLAFVKRINFQRFLSHYNRLYIDCLYETATFCLVKTKESMSGTDSADFVQEFVDLADKAEHNSYKEARKFRKTLGFGILN
jgi:hypothetical protein